MDDTEPYALHRASAPRPVHLGAAASLLVIYSDGASEAQSDDGEFFGEERLVEAIRAHQHLPVSEMVETLARTVVTFSGREQEDDITLVVARCR